jgi:tetraacyldisaccharide 4'-kinase
VRTAFCNEPEMRTLKTPLAALGKLYEAGVRIRNGLYSSGLRRVHRLKQPVISVGNLTMGGTGKTPTVIALGRMLQEAGCSVSVLLRGYKGENIGEPLLVSDGESLLASSQSAGDEAVVIAKNLPRAIVAVGKDRVRTGEWVEQRFRVDAHLLDDGFQHLRLYRNLNLLLVDVTNPFGGERPPPLGRLRESLDGIQRADAVLLTRTQPGGNYQSLIERVRSYKPSILCFRVTQKLVVSSRSQDSGLPGLDGLTALAVAGIANPTQFFDLLERQGLKLADTLVFPDHHRYSVRDLKQVKKRCKQREMEFVVTTEKDAENLDASALDPLRLIVVKVTFVFEDVAEIRKMLSDTVRAMAP